MAVQRVSEAIGCRERAPGPEASRALVWEHDVVGDRPVTGSIVNVNGTPGAAQFGCMDVR